MPWSSEMAAGHSPAPAHARSAHAQSATASSVSPSIRHRTLRASRQRGGEAAASACRTCERTCGGGMACPRKRATNSCHSGSASMRPSLREAAAHSLWISSLYGTPPGTRRESSPGPEEGALRARPVLRRSTLRPPLPAGARRDCPPGAASGAGGDPSPPAPAPPSRTAAMSFDLRMSSRLLARNVEASPGMPGRRHACRSAGRDAAGGARNPTRLVVPRAAATTFTMMNA
mmetsp:Transcript_13443/g.42547  ORF Transcript_13443/g.42547 Transcript_13443/m.42547 type:complete len:231 (-) Transcript_13443:101-793(-)